MKLRTILEMPEFVNSDLPVTDLTVELVTEDSLDREWDVLSCTREGEQLITTAIRKDRSSAVCGRMVIRDDNKRSIEVVVHLKFHEANAAHGPFGDSAVQVDCVEAKKQDQGFGFGYRLYRDIINAGFVVISDNTQFIKGRALWEKIVRRSGIDCHDVFIMYQGELITDDDGKPIVYDGTNYPATRIWGRPGSQQHHHTLLVAKKR